MFNFRSLFSALLLSTVFTAFIVAQPPPSSLPKGIASTNSQIKQEFVSLDGGFSIALPQYVRSFTGINPIAGVSRGGSQFQWENPQSVFVIGYVDRIFTPEDTKQVLQDSVDAVIKAASSQNEKLISQNEISINGISGFELEIQSNGTTKVSRYFLVKERMFILSAVWKDEEIGKESRKILDTFKLIDKNAVLDQRIAEATPPLLPQSPVAKKLKTDAEDERLKGKVKSVLKKEEDLTGTQSFIGAKTRSEVFYDEKGNVIKSINYDYRGNPSEITVYGFIDGFKVSKSGHVKYEYNPPPPAPMPLSVTKQNALALKPVDSRYSLKYENKYDEKGRLQEMSRFGNNGDITGRNLFSYDANKIEQSLVNNDGKLVLKRVEVYNDEGNLIERTLISPNSTSANTVYTYKYEAVDERGNWTKRVVMGTGTGDKKLNYIEYRTITYYQ